jgi:hypothetical protein
MTETVIHFQSIVTKVELKYDNDFNLLPDQRNGADGLLNDGLQRRTFAGQTLKQICEKVLGDYPQNILKRKFNRKEPKIDYEVHMMKQFQPETPSQENETGFITITNYSLVQPESNCGFSCRWNSAL